VDSTCDTPKSYRIIYEELREQNIILNDHIERYERSATKSFYQQNIVLNAKSIKEEANQQEKQSNWLTANGISSSQFELSIIKEKEERIKRTVPVHCDSESRQYKFS
jgi:hypothetical protein